MYQSNSNTYTKKYSNNFGAIITVLIILLAVVFFYYYPSGSVKERFIRTNYQATETVMVNIDRDILPEFIILSEKNDQISEEDWILTKEFMEMTLNIADQSEKNELIASLHEKGHLIEGQDGHFDERSKQWINYERNKYPVQLTVLDFNSKLGGWYALLNEDIQEGDGDLKTNYFYYSGEKNRPYLLHKYDGFKVLSVLSYRMNPSVIGYRADMWNLSDYGVFRESESLSSIFGFDVSKNSVVGGSCYLFGDGISDEDTIMLSEIDYSKYPLSVNEPDSNGLCRRLLDDISSIDTIGWFDYPSVETTFLKYLPNRVNGESYSDEYKDSGIVPTEWFNCTDDCSGHIAGYEWAQDKDIDNEDDCGGYSQSFIEGCVRYVEDYY